MTECFEELTKRCPVTIRRRVKWGDCDPAGVVYTPRFAEYIAVDLRVFLEVLLEGPLGERCAELGFDVPAKALSIEFKSSLRPDQVFLSTVLVGELRTRTYDLHFDARDLSGRAIYIAKFTAICVHHHVRESRAIPAELRSRLEQYRKRNDSGGS